MVDTFGKDIIAAYTGGVSVVSIFTNGVQVWPTSTPPTPTGYYIRWTPSNISGSFTMEGVSYNLQDYWGEFRWDTGIIDSSAFKKCSFSSIETNAVDIGSYAFNDCSNLSYASMSQCTSIWQYAFLNCSSLSYVYLPNCTSIYGPGNFMGCVSLSSIELPVCPAIPRYMCNGCVNLSYVNAPECSYIGSSAFDGCSSLHNVNIPKCSWIDEYAFNSCGFTSLSLSKCEHIGGRTFKNCVDLSVVYLSKCDFIDDYAFYNCTSLQSIYLYYSDTYCTLNGSYVFSYTGITENTGSIYVPASLVNTYKSALHWSYFKNRIYSIP